METLPEEIHPEKNRPEKNRPEEIHPKEAENFLLFENPVRVRILLRLGEFPPEVPPEPPLREAPSRESKRLGRLAHRHRAPNEK